jgi:hypothetical protein
MERAPLTYFTVEQHYNKLVEVSGGYGERVTEARQVLPALERAMKAVLVEKPGAAERRVRRRYERGRRLTGCAPQCACALPGGASVSSTGK